jgi:hypothetical protein
MGRRSCLGQSADEFLGTQTTRGTRIDMLMALIGAIVSLGTLVCMIGRSSARRGRQPCTRLACSPELECARSYEPEPWQYPVITCVTFIWDAAI